MIRAVLDTNTLVSAIINTQSSVSNEIYQNFISKHFLLIASAELLAEVDEVLHRDRIMKFHKLSTKQLQEILTELVNLSYLVPANIKVQVVRDADDNKILSAALDGEADYIISRDKDLLVLKQYQQIKIITPEEFMGILRSTI